MIKAAPLLLLALTFRKSPAEAQKSVQANPVTISGSSVNWILIGEREFQNKLKVVNFENYNVTIEKDDHEVAVLFISADAKEDASIRGNPGTRPGFEVHINPSTRTVIRSNFLR